jgi:serine/threonine-protein kinase
MPALVPEPGVLVGGKYRLVRRIGSGGMGEVWIAKNRTTGAEVAVKMGLGAAAREDSAVRFRLEARLGAMLSHRSIVRIFDLVEETEGTLVLVMELLRGETLERYLQRRGPLPAAEAIAIATPILSALEHAHATGIVHRDVSPANVFLAIDPDGHVTPKLLDFGIAKIPASNAKYTIDGRALGTPRYMAPERIRDQKDVDGRSDLFSVGVILYEMLTGVCPFAAASPAASLAAVLEVVVDPDPSIEPRTWLEIRRALSKRPYERPATADVMARDLLAASGETEATLIEALRQAPLVKAPGSEEVIARATGTVTGHTLGSQAVPGVRRGRAVAWGLGGAVLVAAFVGMLTIRSRAVVPTQAGSVSMRTIEVPSAASAPPSSPSAAEATTSSATAAEVPAPIAPAASASTVPVAAKPPVRPVHPVKKKPVAVTPGF